MEICGHPRSWILARTLIKWLPRIGAAVSVFMILFPPWVIEAPTYRSTYGRHFIFNPPMSGCLFADERTHVDLEPLTAELGIVVIATVIVPLAIGRTMWKGDGTPPPRGPAARD